MSKRLIVGIDDQPENCRALEFARQLAVERGDISIRVLHVLEWSPYSFLTTEELMERKKRRQEELKRAHEVIIDPVVDKFKAEGIDIMGEVRYGNIVDTISDYCKEVEGDMIAVNRTGESRISARLFGSVPGSLVQIADVPVIVVP